jgi:hypothetical protein
MYSLKTGLFAAAVGLCGCVQGAAGGVVHFGLFASNYHWQYNGSGPGNAYAFTFNSRIVSDNPEDFSNAVVVHTTAVTPPMYMSDYGSEWTYTSPAYSTASQRNTNFPTGNYAFQVFGGTMGSTAAFRNYPSSNLFPLSAPAFLNINSFQSVDARNEIEFAPGVFVVPAGATGYTYLAIFDGAGNLVAKGDSAPNVGPFTLPANILMPSQTYTVSLYFSCRVHSEGAGFAGASSDAGWDAITSATLSTVRTCGSSDFNGDGDFGTDQDIEAFFACLGGLCCQNCWSGGSDFNGDGDSGTDQDIEAFFRVLSGANC